jgi:hypothetical protein
MCSTFLNVYLPTGMMSILFMLHMRFMERRIPVTSEYVLCLMMSDYINEDEVGNACSMHNKYKSACRIVAGNTKDKRPLRTPGHRHEDVLKLFLNVQPANLWSVFSYIRLGSSFGLMWIVWWTFWFHRSRIISSPDEWLSFSKRFLLRGVS